MKFNAVDGIFNVDLDILALKLYSFVTAVRTR